jgi:hypothetical protein
MNSTQTKTRAQLEEALHLKIRELQASPTVKGMLQMLRAQGYTITTGILELLDNSLSASARNIRVSLSENFGNLSRIVVTDDGDGMDLDTLLAAWVIAGAPRERRAGEIGKFRVGLKGGTWNSASMITIVSRTKDGDLVGLHADLNAMCESGSFQPTELLVVSETWVRSHLPANAERFLGQTSGTMIQLQSFWPDRIYRVDDVYHTFDNAFRMSYTDTGDCRIEVQQRAAEPVLIPSRDLFHTKDASTALQFPAYETEFLVFSPTHPGMPYRIVEHPREGRQFHGGRVAGGGYYEYHELEKGARIARAFTQLSSEEVERMEPHRIGKLRARVIQTTKDVDEDEREIENRKGFWFFRGIRLVGQALNIGKKLHDRTSTCCERQRMAIYFSPELDDIVGSKFNKQMEANAPLPSRVLTDALFSLYKQVTGPWTKDTPEDEQESVPIIFGGMSKRVAAPAPVVAVTPPPMSPPTIEAASEPETLAESAEGDDVILPQGRIPGYGAADGLLAWLTALKAANEEEYKRTVEFLAV